MPFILALKSFSTTEGFLVIDPTLANDVVARGVALDPFNKGDLRPSKAMALPPAARFTIVSAVDWDMTWR
jgi:hypothetical protein